MRLLLKNAHLYRHQAFSDTDVLIEDGIIKKIGACNEEADQVIDLHGALLSHNFIDIHTHLREPGFEHKETISTGSASALYGGYGTIVAMANTLPCMDDKETIEDFTKRCEKDAQVKTYTYSAITEELKGQKVVDMEENIKQPIVLGFSDDGKGVQKDEKMKEAMTRAKALDSIIVAHCEDESELHGGCIHEGHYAKEHGLIGINSASEYKQVDRDLHLVDEIHNRYHICHISTKETVALLGASRALGERVSGETSPHHLILTEDNIQDCHPNYKMNPPLRTKEDRDAIIKAVNDGVITVIATDHAPHARDEKSKPIDKAPFGIIGLQHAFPLIYTYIVEEGLIKLETVLDCLTTGPAQTLNLDASIEEGMKADLCSFDLNKEYTIKEEDLKSKACNTPFLGWKVKGALIMNIVDGQLLVEE